MRQIRYNVFETNSSSTHSIVICDKWLYDEWLEDRAYLYTFGESIVKSIPEDVHEWLRTGYLTLSEFKDTCGEVICTKQFKDADGKQKQIITIEHFE